MKEFWIYTTLRLLLFAATAAIESATASQIPNTIAAVADSANLMWVLIIALVVSGIASYLLLGRQRSALARHVDARARRASLKFEEMRAKEDVD